MAMLHDHRSNENEGVHVVPLRQMLCWSSLRGPWLHWSVNGQLQLPTRSLQAALAAGQSRFCIGGHSYVVEPPAANFLDAPTVVPSIADDAGGFYVMNNETLSDKPNSEHESNLVVRNADGQRMK